MPGTVRPVNDERDALLAYLAQQRDALRLAAYGLSDAQARATPTPSALSVGGIVKHVTSTERYWVDVVLGGGDALDDEGDYLDNLRMGDDEHLDELLERYAGTAAHTEAVMAGEADMGRPVPVQRDVPWFPHDVEAWSVRWVLLHLVEETARHAGHADIVREAVDGATAYPLMAAAEGWPATPWITPWSPAP